MSKTTGPQDYVYFRRAKKLSVAMTVMTLVCIAVLAVALVVNIVVMLAQKDAATKAEFGEDGYLGAYVNGEWRDFYFEVSRFDSIYARLSEEFRGTKISVRITYAAEYTSKFREHNPELFEDEEDPVIEEEMNLSGVIEEVIRYELLHDDGTATVITAEEYRSLPGRNAFGTEVTKYYRYDNTIVPWSYVPEDYVEIKYYNSQGWQSSDYIHPEEYKTVWYYYADGELDGVYRKDKEVTADTFSDYWIYDESGTHTGEVTDGTYSAIRQNEPSAYVLCIGGAVLLLVAAVFGIIFSGKVSYKNGCGVVTVIVSSFMILTAVILLNGFTSQLLPSTLFGLLCAAAIGAYVVRLLLFYASAHGTMWHKTMKTLRKNGEEERAASLENSAKAAYDAKDAEALASVQRESREAYEFYYPQRKLQVIAQQAKYIGEKQYVAEAERAKKANDLAAIDRIYREVEEKYTAKLAAEQAEKERLLAEAKAASKARLAASNLSLEYEGKSVFDGRLIQKIGWRLLGGLVTVVTLGIAYPAAMCFTERWKTKHTVIEGRRLSFDGKGIQLLGKWILWILLSVVTIGVFALFVPVRLEKWRAKHTTVVGGAVAGEFDGNVLQRIGWWLLAGLLTLVTIGIAYPAAMCMKLRWTTKHKIYDGCRLTFDGKGIQLFGKWMLWLLLSLVTLGIYVWFIPIKLEKWKVSHIHFA